jgi:hypothetical protein
MHTFRKLGEHAGMPPEGLKTVHRQHYGCLEARAYISIIECKYYLLDPRISLILVSIQLSCLILILIELCSRKVLEAGS